MMAAPDKNVTPVAPPRNLHAGAVAAGLPPAPVAKSALDETAELFRSVFKGEIIP